MKNVAIGYEGVVRMLLLYRLRVIWVHIRQLGYLLIGRVYQVHIFTLRGQPGQTWFGRYAPFVSYQVFVAPRYNIRRTPNWDRLPSEAVYGFRWSDKDGHS